MVADAEDRRIIARRKKPDVPVLDQSVFSGPAPEPTASFSTGQEYKPSVRQKIADVTATIDANIVDAEKTFRPYGTVYTKRGNEWNAIAAENYVGNGLIEEVEPMAALAAQKAGLQNLLSSPFKWLGSTDQARKTFEVSASGYAAIPGSNYLSEAVGVGADSLQWAGQTMYDNTLKPFVRSTAVLAWTPFQIMENLIMFGPSQIAPAAGETAALEAPNASVWEQVQGLFTNTTLAQTVITQDVGEGFFGGGEAEVARNKLEDTLRPKIYGQTGTVGRLMAAGVVETGLIQPGDDNYKFISGLVDAGVNVYLDPLNWSSKLPKGLKTFPDSPTKQLSSLQLRKLGKLTADEAGAFIGPPNPVLVQGTMNGVNMNQYELWKRTRSGVKTIEGLTTEQSPYQVWRNSLKRRSPHLAVELADTRTVDRVAGIMDDAVMSPDPYKRMAGLPGWSGHVVSELGYRTKNLMSNTSRIAATLPRSLTLMFDDLDAGARYADDVLQILNPPPAVREALMNEYLRIVAQTDPAAIKGDLFDWAVRFKNVAVEARASRILDKLDATKNMLPEDMTLFQRVTAARRVEVAAETREILSKYKNFTSTERSFTAYTLDDLGNARPLEWLDGNGLGPLYPSQQLNSGISLLDPSELDDMIKLTQRLAEFRVLARTVPMGKGVSAALKTTGKGALWTQTQWKKSVLFAGRYVARVVPEEMTRVSVSGEMHGEFSYVAEVIGGRLNKDIWGRMTPGLDEASDLQGILDEIGDLFGKAEDARLAGNTKLAAKLDAKIAKLDEAGTTARLEEVEAILEGTGASVRDAMIGPKPDMAADTALGHPVRNFTRADTQQIIPRAAGSHLYLQGIGQEVIERASNRVAKAVSGAILNGKPNSLDDIADRLFSGNLRPHFEDYFNGEGKMLRGYNWDTPDGAMRYAEVVWQDILDSTGGHRTLLAAIRDSTVTIDGAPFSIGRRTAEGNIPSPEFLRIMREGDAARPLDPIFDGWTGAPTHTTVYPKAGTAEVVKKQEMFSWFMQHAYGKASDKFARVPMWNVRKWNLIADMSPLLSPAEAAQLRTFIPSYGLPKWVEENVLGNLHRAQGTGTLKELDNLAGAQATEDVINLLFDARKRTLYGRQHRILFPFFDAFREVGTQLMKTALNPTAVHKIDKAVDALENVQVGGPGDTNLIGPGDVDGDGKTEGFVYSDPQTGLKTWNIPLVSAVAKLFSDIPFNLKISAKSMTMMTSVLPSTGPFVGIAYSAIPDRTSKNFELLNKIFVPFGDPTKNELQSFFVPIAMSRIAQGAANIELPVVGAPLKDIVNMVLGDPNDNDVFNAMRNRIVQAELGSGKYPKTQDGIRQAMDRSEDMAHMFWLLRGIVQEFSPAAPATQFYGKIDKKLLPLGVYLDAVRTYGDEFDKRGGTFNERMDALMNRFGESVIPMLATLSQSNVPGSQSTKAFYDFKNQNEPFFKKYPAIAGFFAPPSTGIDWDVYSIQRRSGELSLMSVPEITKQVSQMWGNLMYDAEKRRLNAVYGSSPAVSGVLSIAAGQVRTALPDWDPELAAKEWRSEVTVAMNAIVKASDDGALTGFPASQSLLAYLAVRQTTLVGITASTNATSIESWKTNMGGRAKRQELYDVGVNLANYDPTFKPLWDRVLSNEFKWYTEQELTLLKSGVKLP